MPRISVVLPCYNVAKYIDACLDSLVNQTLSDIEIICVDDKSPDNTVDVIKKRMALDSRIKLIELPKNSGVSVARNTGIDAASGDYIGFVDPDDYLDLDFYEKLYNKIVAENAEICVGNVAEHMLGGKVWVRKDIIGHIIKNKRHFCYTVWCAIYKTSFIKNNQIYCPAGITNGEDTVFCIKCAILAQKVVGRLDTFYHYIRYENSAESKYYKEKHVDSRIKVANIVVDFINTAQLSNSDYVHYFNKVFRPICHDVFEKTTRRDLHLKALQGALDAYKKSKHPEYFDSKYIGPYLRCDDLDGLYQRQKDEYSRPSKVFIKLFKVIPIIRIRYYENGTKISVLGIPVLYSKKVNKGILDI